MKRVIFAMLAAALLSTSAHALDKVVLQLKWRHQFQFAGYYAAVTQGYYRDAGFDVELREADTETDTVKEVVSGRAQYGVGTSDLVLARAQGQPVVVLAVIYQHSPFVLLTPASSGIEDVQSLADKPIMMEKGAAELLAFFRNEGVDPARLKILPHTFDEHDLLNGHAVAMSAYSTDEPYKLKAEGVPYLTFSPRTAGIDFYGDNLFTSETEMREHPERAKAFVDASVRGWVYAMQHPEEIVTYILATYPRGKSRDHLLFEAEETRKLIHPELIEIGYVNPGRWQAIAETYADLGMMPHHQPLDGFVYERDPRIDWRRYAWPIGIAAALALIAGGWALVTMYMNRRLHREVGTRREAEVAATRASEAKTRFLAVLAHEVRSPLSGIISSLHLWREEKDPATREEVAAIAQTSANTLLQTVDEILHHSEIESGSAVAIQLQPVDVRDFLGSIITHFRASAQLKSLDLGLEVDPAVPATLPLDPLRLRQILSNLITNALKFTDEGFVRLHASVEPAATSGDRQLILEVVDSGPGLTPEQIGRIFTPYAQADQTIAHRYGGTGLGLSISADLARLLGGDISVESDGRTGATFTVRLPIAASPAIATG
ncbi:MAG: hypothetical protein BGO12_18315 [Verrucomicrobia bacterium 61-8]|nr:ABC transporter substrate-binding protein [Verrucomicrobiota bacterium]OJU99700.1 MAG: hypothetical protein BGO12_18315 [Verrucomicrobia bacterium 61-8]